MLHQFLDRNERRVRCRVLLNTAPGLVWSGAVFSRTLRGLYGKIEALSYLEEYFCLACIVEELLKRSDHGDDFVLLHSLFHSRVSTGSHFDDIWYWFPTSDRIRGKGYSLEFLCTC